MMNDGIRFSDFERRQIAALRKELDDEYQATITPKPNLSAPQSPTRFRSSSWT